jgi:hypothetical protein
MMCVSMKFSTEQVSPVILRRDYSISVWGWHQREIINNKKKKKNQQQKKSFHNLCLTTVYFPHSGYKETELESFHAELSSFLSNILANKNTTHIIGVDTNSSIGMKASLLDRNVYPDKHESYLDVDPTIQLLGAFRNPRKSKTGDEVLNMMREHHL